MKKILALLMAVLMVVSLAACGSSDDSKKDTNNAGTNNAGTNNNGNTDNGGSSDDGGSTTTPEKVTISVWTADLDQGEGGWLEDRMAAFKAAYPQYDVTFEVGVMSEGDVGDKVKLDPEAAADVFMFPNDQLGALVECGALAQLVGDYEDQVYNDNSDTFVNTVMYTDGGIYGFPVTNNTWFMYYNKSVYNAEDIKTIDGLLAKGVISMQIANGWYNASFFTANGGTLFGDSGLDDTKGIQFGGEAGYQTAAAMIALATNKNFLNDADQAALAGMMDGSVSAMFSGSWDYDKLYASLGDNLGCAPLPTITINGQQKQLKAFAGSKAVAVNRNADYMKASLDFAAFLASEESQLKRFEMRGVTPAHINLGENATVLASPVAAAEMAVMNNCSIAQPTIAAMSSFWSPAGNFGNAILLGDVNMDNYKDQVDLLYKQLNNETL